MAVFEYKGVNRSGQFLKGSIEAENVKSARQKLKTQGLYLQEIKVKLHEKTDQSLLFNSKKVSVKYLAIFTRLLASLLRSNVPLVEALDSISQQLSHSYFSVCVAHLRDQVNEGKPFHLALKKYPDVFDVIYVSLCESGEASGTLDQILEEIANLMEKRAHIRSKVLNALFYPAILFVVAMTVMIVLCVYVIPGLMEIFEDTENLPWMTQFTLALSQFLIDYWLSLIVFSLFSYSVFIRWKKTKKGKKSWDRFVLSIPVFGRLVRAADIALFAKTLSTLLKGGVPVLKSMDIVKNVLSNEMLKIAIEQARDNIKEGEPMVTPLTRSGQFPPVVLQIIKVGEKTGELESMLDQISSSYDRQVETEVSAFTALLGPVMILLMTVIIVFILMSVLLPMLSSFDAIESL